MVPSYVNFPAAPTLAKVRCTYSRLLATSYHRRSPYHFPLFFPSIYDETSRVNQPPNTTGSPFIADFLTLAKEKKKEKK